MVTVVASVHRHRQTQTDTDTDTDADTDTRAKRRGKKGGCVEGGKEGGVRDKWIE